MMLLHFLQRILNTLPRTFSSAIEYLAEQASQTIFIVGPREARHQQGANLASSCAKWPEKYKEEARAGATRRVGTRAPDRCWRLFSAGERIAQQDRVGAVGADRHQPHRGADEALEGAHVGACRRRQVVDRARAAALHVPAGQLDVLRLGAQEILAVGRRL